MKTRMWIMETDRYGATEKKFYVDDPQHIPRIGEFIDGDDAGGWVSVVQYNYRTENQKIHPTALYKLIINVFLTKEKPNGPNTN